MDEVREKAKELAEALTRSQEYQEFLKAKNEVDGSVAASKMLNDFINLQKQLQEAQLRGENISEEKIRELQSTWTMINFNPYIQKYFMADFTLLSLLGEIIMTLGNAVGMDLSAFDPSAGQRDALKDEE